MFTHFLGDKLLGICVRGVYPPFEKKLLGFSVRFILQRMAKVHESGPRWTNVLVLEAAALARHHRRLGQRGPEVSKDQDQPKT